MAKTLTGVEGPLVGFTFGLMRAAARWHTGDVVGMRDAWRKVGHGVEEKALRAAGDEVAHFAIGRSAKALGVAGARKAPTRAARIAWAREEKGRRAAGRDGVRCLPAARTDSLEAGDWSRPCAREHDGTQRVF